jgi:hypothetical protein
VRYGRVRDHVSMIAHGIAPFNVQNQESCNNCVDGDVDRLLKHSSRDGSRRLKPAVPRFRVRLSRPPIGRQGAPFLSGSSVESVGNGSGSFPSA